MDLMTTPSPTLFQQVLGAAFFRLPESLRRLHGTRGLARHAGVVTVEGGSNALARLCARIAGLPKPMQDAPLKVEFACDARAETWKRDFDGSPMTSRLVLRKGLLHERIGPLHFRYALHANEGAIWWTVAGARLLGVLPLPAALFDGVRCQERELQGRYAFLVEASLPVVGRVVRYAGWLEPADL
jgi:hypothetical protein